MSITEEQKQIVKSTAPILKEHGKEITSIFYKNMFSDHPELLDMFNITNQKIGTQPLALANTIYFAAENIDHLDVLLPQVLMIAHKHRALRVLPEHYPIVGENLLKAIKIFLADQATQEILDAWKAAYIIIADVFIKIEQQLYQELGSDERDKDFLPFTIIQKEIVANGPIIALTLTRSDHGELHPYQPGQYLTIRIKKDGRFHNRHYSLIEPYNGKTYRIAIKAEIDHEPKGIVSSEIIDHYQQGDQILASFPAGTFTLIPNANHHLFIAGGIGITVLSAMIEQLYLDGKSDQVILIHCVSTKEHAAFTEHLQSILPHENQYRLLTQNQRLDRQMLKEILRNETEVYLCGSIRFLNQIENLLDQCVHPSSQIHIEAFQPSLSAIKGVKDTSTIQSFSIKKDG